MQPVQEYEHHTLIEHSAGQHNTQSTQSLTPKRPQYKTKKNFLATIIIVVLIICANVPLFRFYIKNSEQIRQLNDDVANYHRLFVSLGDILNCSKNSCLDEATRMKSKLDNTLLSENSCLHEAEQLKLNLNVTLMSEKSFLDEAARLKSNLYDTLFIIGCNTSSINNVTCLTEKKTDSMKKKEFDRAVKLQLESKAKAKSAAISGSPKDDNEIILTDAAANEQDVFLLDRFKPQAMWAKSFPRFNVVGAPKAGTSQLYKILSDHVDVSPINPGIKEFCCRCKSLNMKDPNTQKCVYEYRNRMHQLYLQVPKNHSTVNGCIETVELRLHYQYLPPAEAKYFYLLRDPADLLWASYNFWTHGMDTDIGDAARWTNPTRNYRTPELFHELIASRGKLQGATELFERITTTIDVARMLLKSVGRDNILFLRNEDMEPSHVVQTSFLAKLSNFSGLVYEKFNRTSIFERVNCNDAKGVQNACKMNDYGTYQISGKRKMFEETRSLIYLMFKEECIVWAREFGIEYLDCINAGMD